MELHQLTGSKTYQAIFQADLKKKTPFGKEINWPTEFSFQMAYNFTFVVGAIKHENRDKIFLPIL